MKVEIEYINENKDGTISYYLSNMVDCRNGQLHSTIDFLNDKKDTGFAYLFIDRHAYDWYDGHKFYYQKNNSAQGVSKEYLYAERMDIKKTVLYKNNIRKYLFYKKKDLRQIDVYKNGVRNGVVIKFKYEEWE